MLEPISQLNPIRRDLSRTYIKGNGQTKNQCASTRNECRQLCFLTMGSDTFGHSSTLTYQSNSNDDERNDGIDTHQDIVQSPNRTV